MGNLISNLRTSGTSLRRGGRGALAWVRAVAQPSRLGLFRRLCPLLLLGSLSLFAVDETKEVHVIEETLVGGVATQLRDQTLLTGGDYMTQMAPVISGQIFTHWSISRTQAFVNRDRLGRAKDSVTYYLYEPTTLTANYLPVDEDADKDGVADGWEIYWYGDLDETADSDTDGDGLTLAQEIAAGTNPLMPDESVEGGIVWDDGGLLQYNPDGLQPYTIRSEPEGKLFATISDYAVPGTVLTTPTCNRSVTAFSYWTCDGVRIQDRHGRSLDGVSFVMPSQAVEYVAVCIDDSDRREQHYWYGREMSMESDTDGDGLTLAQEIAAGTNPLMPDESVEGGIVWGDGEYLETDLQVYEQARGAVVSERFEELFTSPIAGNGATSATFGTNLQPVVADVNGDGLWDIVLVYEGGVRVFVNVGGKGNPEFEEFGKKDENDGNDGKDEVAELLAKSGVDLAMNSTAKLATMSLDVAPVGALSATTWGDGTLLVSDAEGRIWYYRGLKDENDIKDEKDEDPESFTSLSSFKSFVLQHKVWGGSCAGFANGLRLAAVDWDDDGDLDCLAGTAEGKLMLLRDPKVGRPTNLKSLVGIDNVKLVWEPNAQSRVRGYRVYRKDANDGRDDNDAASWLPLSFESFGSFLSFTTALPTYRDYPPEIRDYDYKVSSVSCFYTAGNSTPIVSESMPTEAVRASMGKVKFLWSDAAAFVDEEVQVKLGVENSLNLSGKGLSLSIAYDADDLQPVRVETSGLTEKVALTDSAVNGQWTVSASGGGIAAGGGTFVTFVFKGLRASTGEVALVSAALKSVGGAMVTPVLPEKNARVEVWTRQPDTPTDPRYVGPYGKWDMNGDGWLTWEDRQLMAQLMQGGPNKKYTAEQLRAGDDNGNGELDNHDFQQMKADFDELGIKNNEDDKKEVL